MRGRVRAARFSRRCLTPDAPPRRRPQEHSGNDPSTQLVPPATAGGWNKERPDESVPTALSAGAPRSRSLLHACCAGLDLAFACGVASASVRVGRPLLLQSVVSRAPNLLPPLRLTPPQFRRFTVGSTWATPSAAAVRSEPGPAARGLPDRRLNPHEYPSLGAVAAPPEAAKHAAPPAYSTGTQARGLRAARRCALLLRPADAASTHQRRTRAAGLTTSATWRTCAAPPAPTGRARTTASPSTGRRSAVRSMLRGEGATATSRRLGSAAARSGQVATAGLAKATAAGPTGSARLPLAGFSAAPTGMACRLFTVARTCGAALVTTAAQRRRRSRASRLLPPRVATRTTSQCRTACVQILLRRALPRSTLAPPPTPTGLHMMRR